MKFFLSLVLLSLSVVSCSKNSNEQQDNQEASNTYKKYDGPVVKNDWSTSWLSANPQILNPMLSTDVYSTPIVGLVFDTLISFRPDNAEPIGKLAKSWKISKDGLVYDFFLKEGVKFHDGVELTAEDVKFSFERIKDPKINAAHLQNYFKNFDRVEAVSKYHVRFTMTTAYFRNLIMLGLFEIMPKHIYGKGDFNTLEANRKPLGSGPYIFSKWDQGRLIELSLNKNYWGLQDPYFKDRNNFLKQRFRIITENTVAALALKKGEIDQLSPTPEQYLNDFTGKDFESRFHKLKYSTDDGAGYGFIAWKLDHPLFNSKEVRQALAMAMPRQEINEKIYQGIRTLAVSPFPTGSLKLDPTLKPIQFDLETAKQKLASAGWKDSNNDGVLEKDGKDFRFDLLFTAQNAESERIALVYQQSLKKLGIELNIRTLEWTVFIKQVREGSFDAVMLGWGSSLDSDPYQIWHSSQFGGGGSNFNGFKNKEVDALLEKARVTLDRDERNKLYQQFSKIVADEAPYLFLFEKPSLYIVTKRFENVLPIGKLGPDSDHFFTPPGREIYQEKTAE